MYKILPYTLNKAKKLNVNIKTSTDKSKKLDVFDLEGNYICSVGAAGMSDYPTYIKTHGLAYAQYRRLLYKQRHERNRHIVGSKGYYADQLLW